MTTEYFIVFIILTFGAVYCSSNSDTCGSFEAKAEHFNVQLVGHSVSEIVVSGHHECAKECMTLSVCKSIDYYRPYKTCKLNDVDSLSVDSSEFTSLPGAIYSDISAWPSDMVGTCGLRPCARDQRCINGRDTYTCINIVCDEEPSLENGNITLGGLDKNKFLDSATLACEESYIPERSSVRCQCNGTWEPVTCSLNASDCTDILQKIPMSVSGVYHIYLWSSQEKLSVYCDMDTANGGWTVFQRRFNGITDFYRNFSEYINGFGSADGEYWLGLKHIQEIAEQGATEIRIDMAKADNTTAFETFLDFYIDGPDYTLRLGTRTGGNSGYVPFGFVYNNGYKFSTFDHDRDGKASNCAVNRHGAWWYHDCTWINLNGNYCTPGTTCIDTQNGMSGLTHQGFSEYHSMKSSSMMIRRVTGYSTNYHAG